MSPRYQQHHSNADYADLETVKLSQLSLPAAPWNRNARCHQPQASWGKSPEVPRAAMILRSWKDLMYYLVFKSLYINHLKSLYKILDGHWCEGSLMCSFTFLHRAVILSNSATPWHIKHAPSHGMGPAPLSSSCCGWSRGRCFRAALFRRSQAWSNRPAKRWALKGKLGKWKKWICGSQTPISINLSDVFATERCWHWTTTDTHINKQS